jgi:hypothetical protein
VIHQSRTKQSLSLLAVLTLLAGPGLAEPAAPSDAASQTGAESQTGAVAVSVTLQNTELKESEIRQALANEFRAPVVKGDGKQGLLLSVDGQKLQARYLDAAGQVIERAIDLPREKRHQLDTIALLSGNLARDEAGELLAELRAAQAAEATLPEPRELPEPAELPEPPPLAEGDKPVEPPADSSADSKKAPSDKKPAEKKPQEAGPRPARAKNPEAQDPSRPLLPVTEFSAALWGDITYPDNIDQKKSHIHLGLVHSEIGSLQGFGANLLILRNLARDRYYAGEGVQAAIAWSETQGFFRGFQGAVIASLGKGGIEGVQGAAIFSFQKNETLGAQLAGVASLSMSDIEGGQGAGTFAGLWGDLKGVQAAGAVTVTTGDLLGAQLAGGAAIVGGRIEGFQAAPVTFAAEVDGFQLAVANLAYKKMEGFQLAVGNFAGDVQGTQIGLLNIGGKVEGAQIGVINIAKDVKGVAFAPVNIIPGIRNQIVLYESWTPATATEATPAGPVTHLGFKFMPEPFYTQLTFGIGAEAEACPDGLLPGDAGCTGNGVFYAPGFAVGARAKLVGGLFLESDLQYQFESAFGPTNAHRHAALARAALGYDFSKKFGIYAGGGPRMDVQADAQGKYNTNPTWSPHVFAGIQVF